MAISYYLSSTPSDFSTGVAFSTVLASATSPTVILSVNVSSGGVQERSSGWTPAGTPGLSTGVIGDYSVKVHPVQTNANVLLSVQIHRVDANNIVMASSPVSAKQNCGTIGVQTHFFPGVNLGTWNATHRLRVDYIFESTSAHGNNSLGIDANGVTAEIVTPFPSASIIAKTASDAGTLSITESSTLSITSSKTASDTASLSITETSVVNAQTPPTTNQLSNPSFETDTAGWSAVGNPVIARVADGTAWDGQGHARITSNVVGNVNIITGNFPITGSNYSAGVYARWVSGTPRETRVDIQFLDVNGTVLSTAVGPRTTPATGLIWQQIKQEAIAADPLATQVRLRITALNAAATDVFEIDAAQLEPSAMLPPYNPIASTDPTYKSTWVGGTTSNSAVIVSHTTNTDNTNNVHIKYSVNSDMSNAQVTADVAATSTGAARHELVGLAANTTYYYRVVVDTTELEGGSFKTFPTTPTTFSFGYASCRNSNQDSTAFLNAKNRGIQFFIECGDLHYENISVEDPALYHEGYNDFLSQTYAQSLVRDIPVVYTWDDHDFCGNGSWSESTGKTSARSVYRERVPHYTLPSAGIEQTFVCGPARFIVLDTRSYRDLHTDADGPTKTMLGATQKQWLKDLVNNSTESVIFVVSSVGWIGQSGDGYDHWGWYPDERAELGAVFQTSGKVIILSGDAHMLALDDGTNSVGGVPVFHAAPLRQANSVKGGPYSHGTFDTGDMNFGYITINDDRAGNVSVTYDGVKQDDTIWLSYTKTFSSGEPTIKAASDASTVSITESSNLFISQTAFDTATLSITEAPGIFVDVQANDAGSIGVTESTAGFVTANAFDISTLSATESTNTFVTLRVSDLSVATITEATSGSVTFTATDQGVLSISETSEIIGSNDRSAADSATLSVVESATVVIETEPPVPTTSSDTATLSITESTQTFVADMASDTNTVSITEQIDLFVTLSASDASALSLSENVTSALTQTATDSGTISIDDVSHFDAQSNNLSAFESINLVSSETSTVEVYVQSSDALDLTVIESAQAATSENRSASDVAVLSISESTPVVTVTESNIVHVYDPSLGFRPGQIYQFKIDHWEILTYKVYKNGEWI